MRKLYLLFTLIMVVCCAMAQPKQIKTFNDLMTSLNQGENVRTIIHYAKCTLIRNNELQEKSPDAISGLNIDTYEYFARMAVRGNEKAFVVFSANHFIQNPIGSGYAFNYGKVKVEEDSKITITVTYVNPITLEETMNQKFYTQINDGKNDGGVLFFLQQ
jgi:hypothetical protein